LRSRRAAFLVGRDEPDDDADGLVDRGRHRRAEPHPLLEAGRLAPHHQHPAGFDAQRPGHVQHDVGLLADDPPEPGDWILIHVGFALSKIDESEAAAALEFLEGIGQAYADELAALQTSQIE
jgi:hydrogenase assembly chaperone HypC/HupF